MGGGSASILIPECTSHPLRLLWYKNYPGEMLQKKKKNPVSVTWSNSFQDLQSSTMGYVTVYNTTRVKHDEIERIKSKICWLQSLKYIHLVCCLYLVEICFFFFFIFQFDHIAMLSFICLKNKINLRIFMLSNILKYMYIRT